MYLKLISLRYIRLPQKYESGIISTLIYLGNVCIFF